MSERNERCSSVLLGVVKPPLQSRGGFSVLFFSIKNLDIVLMPDV